MTNSKGAGFGCLLGIYADRRHFVSSWLGSGDIRRTTCYLALVGVMVKSFVRFSPFARGKIVGKAEEGAPVKKIRKTVLKRDGKRGSERAIKAVLAKARADPF